MELKQGKKPEGRALLVGRICLAVTDYWKDGPDMTTMASENGWPLEIDFAKVPEQIMKLKNEIEGLLTNQFRLNNLVTWKSFVTLLKGADCKMADFHSLGDWSKFRAVGTNAHAG